MVGGIAKIRWDLRQVFYGYYYIKMFTIIYILIVYTKCLYTHLKSRNLIAIGIFIVRVLQEVQHSLKLVEENGSII